MLQPVTEAPRHTRKQILLGLVAIFLIYITSFYYIQTLAVARPRMAAELKKRVDIMAKR